MYSVPKYIHPTKENNCLASFRSLSSPPLPVRPNGQKQNFWEHGAQPQPLEHGSAGEELPQFMPKEESDPRVHRSAPCPMALSFSPHPQQPSPRPCLVSGHRLTLHRTTSVLSWGGRRLWLPGNVAAQATLTSLASGQRRKGNGLLGAAAELL